MSGKRSARPTSRAAPDNNLAVTHPWLCPIWDYDENKFRYQPTISKELQQNLSDIGKNHTGTAVPLRSKPNRHAEVSKPAQRCQVTLQNSS